MEKWCILSKNYKVTYENNIELRNYNFSFTKSEKLKFFDSINAYIYLDGYILPLIKHFDRFKEMGPFELIEFLILNYGKSFIEYLKGNFNIVICFDNYYFVINDRIGIKKFFYFIKSNDNFIISNHTDSFYSNINLSIDYENIAIHTLFHHFLAGKTYLSDILYSQPATFINSKNCEIFNYWKIDELLNLGIEFKEYDEVTNQFKMILSQYIQYLKPKDISLTLTGGLDTRTILAGLLSLNMTPHCYSFGNKYSGDVINANLISNTLGLDYVNYEVEPKNWEEYNDYTNELIMQGCSLIHIHRAHRLAAFKQHIKLRYNDNHILFVGSMGGEGVRGIHLDNLIITDFTKNIVFNELPIIEQIQKVFNKYFIKSEIINIQNLIDFIKRLDFFSGKKKNKEFKLLYQLTAAVHDSQDINIYNNNGVNTIPLFLDIDYLFLIFSSPYNMLYKNNISKNQFKRLDIPEFSCNLINLLYPKLSDIEFVYNYKPKEYLYNKYYYFFIRSIRHYLRKKSDIPNFSYDDWFVKYIHNNLINISEKLHPIFDTDLAFKKISEEKHKNNEGYWHPYSNIVMFNKIIKENKSEI